MQSNSTKEGTLKSQLTSCKSLTSKFDVGETLGEGAFGAVVAGVNKTTGKEVAIKQMQVDFTNFYSVKKLLREVKI